MKDLAPVAMLSLGKALQPESISRFNADKVYSSLSFVANELFTFICILKQIMPLLEICLRCAKNPTATSSDAIEWHKLALEALQLSLSQFDPSISQPLRVR